MWSHAPPGGAPNRSEASPFEMRPRIGFSSARQRYVLMTNTICNWIGFPEYFNELPQNPVLNVFERDVVTAFELDTNRKVITPASTVPLRLARVPGPRLTGHELNQFAIAADQEMRRNRHMRDGFEIRISRRIKTIGKQLRDFIAAKASRWQADTVNNDEFYATARRAGIAVRGGNLTRSIQHAISSQ